MEAVMDNCGVGGRSLAELLGQALEAAVSGCGPVAAVRAGQSCSPGLAMLEYQKFPSEGPLRANLNRSLAELRTAVGGADATVYCYVVDTVRYLGGGFRQTGSGPNWQGDRLTLCTCKHHMRSWLTEAQWRNCWVAGFSGVNRVDRGNYLVYLMKVDEAYGSHADLWRSRSVSRVTKEAKVASRNILGDLYEPMDGGGDPHSPAAYRPPMVGHVHEHGAYWRKDVDEVYTGGRRPSLLVGDPERSFLWSEPAIRLSWELQRTPPPMMLSKLLQGLG
jgi:hypothetical protein